MSTPWLIARLRRRLRRHRGGDRQGADQPGAGAPARHDRPRPRHRRVAGRHQLRAQRRLRRRHGRGRSADQPRHHHGVPDVGLRRGPADRRGHPATLRSTRVAVRLRPDALDRHASHLLRRAARARRPDRTSRRGALRPSDRILGRPRRPRPRGRQRAGRPRLRDAGLPGRPVALAQRHHPPGLPGRHPRSGHHGVPLPAADGASALVGSGSRRGAGGSRGRPCGPHRPPVERETCRACWPRWRRSRPC